MKKTTKRMTKMVQDELLALSDAMLMETLTQWLDLAEDELAYLDWSDEYCCMLGYRIQSDATGAIYSSFEALDDAEPDGACVSWVTPSIEMIRSFLVNLSPEDFYHVVLPLASDALRRQAYQEGWGSPPSVASDGYDFIRCLIVHLRYKGLKEQGMGDGCVSFSQQPSGKRRPMKHFSSDLAFGHIFSRKNAELCAKKTL